MKGKVRNCVHRNLGDKKNHEFPNVVLTCVSCGSKNMMIFGIRLFETKCVRDHALSGRGSFHMCGTEEFAKQMEKVGGQGGAEGGQRAGHEGIALERTILARESHSENSIERAIHAVDERGARFLTHVKIQ